MILYFSQLQIKVKVKQAAERKSWMPLNLNNKHQVLTHWAQGDVTVILQV